MNKGINTVCLNSLIDYENSKSIGTLYLHVTVITLVKKFKIRRDSILTTVKNTLSKLNFTPKMYWVNLLG